jgi:histidinol-phosphate aminotransferase
MPISRRSLLRRFGATVVAAAARPPLRALAMQAVPPVVRAGSSPILLNRNENPYGPSEKVLGAIRDAAVVGNRYPRTEYDSLIARIATLHAAKPEQVALGCGSSEILRSIASVFLGPGKRLVQASPTYPAIAHFARDLGAEVVDVHINKMYAHDLEAMLIQAGNSAAVVYICNPNNPTGSLTARKDIEAFLHQLSPRAIVVIDEAYHHFVSPNASYMSFLDQPLDDPRVIVVRTFSKIYGLAGMRVGYAVAAPDVARHFSADRLQFGMSVISAKGAAAALDDSEYVRLAIQRNADDRQEFMNQVNIRMLRALDSHANFVLLNPMRSPERVVEHLKGHNILIGPLIPAMNKYVRISLGATADMEEFWRVWDLMPPPGDMAM